MVLCICAALLVTWIPFLFFVLGNQDVLYNSLAADVHYYARMARSFTQFGFFSFDERTVSNGFMPLWQLLTTALDFSHTETDAPDVLLKKMFLLSALMTGTATAGLSAFLCARFGTLPTLIALPLLIPGALYWAAQIASASGGLTSAQYSFSIWSFANGMESSLGLVLFVVWLPIAARVLSAETATPTVAFIAGVVAFLVFMARLDDVFLGVALFLGILLSSAPDRVALARYFAVAPIIGAAAYVAANIVWADSALPVSGLGKTSIFSFPSGLWHLAQIGIEATYEARLVPILGAFTVGTVGLVTVILSGRATGNIYLVLSLYLLMKAGFLYSSVPLVHQGFWYYAIMVAAINLMVGAALLHLLSLAKLRAVLPVLAAFAVVISGAMAVVAQRSLSSLQADTPQYVAHELCQGESEVRDLLRQALTSESNRGIIDTGDGVYAFCLGAPAFTVTGLGDSQATSRGMAELGFANYAVSRGHPIVVESDIEWASYDWRKLVGDFETQLIAEHGSLQMWRLVAPGTE